MLKVARTDYCCPVAAPTKITALAHVKAYMGEEAAAVSTGGGSEELAEVLWQYTAVPWAATQTGVVQQYSKIA
jgi:hypothetical protein